MFRHAYALQETKGFNLSFNNKQVSEDMDTVTIYGLPVKLYPGQQLDIGETWNDFLRC